MHAMCTFVSKLTGDTPSPQLLDALKRVLFSLAVKKNFYD